MSSTLSIQPLADGTARKFLRVLYADDMRELRELMRLSLSRDGHSIKCFPDGNLAFEHLRANPDFDLVITDHHMPNANGLEFVRQLRTLPTFHGKVMVFSSELNPSVATEYHRLGVDRVLYKPVYPSALRQVLAELFGGFSA